jgi:hypothetical protein
VLNVIRDSVLLAAALLATALSCAGCSSVSSCNRDEDTIEVDGFVNADRTEFSSVKPVRLEAEDGSPLPREYIDSLPPFTHFPANRIIKFHVGLVDIPTDINVYLSFREGRDATLAPAAGNQSLIRKRSKDEIVLRNDTCSEFWVWLTASTSATPFGAVSDAGTGAAGASGASGADESETAGAAGAL